MLIRCLIVALALLGATPAEADRAAEVHAAERARLGYGELRPGADGNDPDAPNAVNYDEAKAGNLPLPRLPADEGGRLQMSQALEDEWVGQVPWQADQLVVAWSKVPLGRNVEHWIGTVSAPDGRKGPTIDATITFPAFAESAPALIAYTYVWPGGKAPEFAGPPPPDAVAQALRHGFAYVEYRPQMLQPDTAATMQDGVIGLAKWPREETDWGALRAWAWGASKLREALALDPRINAARISLSGHSRFGKGVLVAAAFDHEFADALVSSSGAGGAKIMRRDFGERWENMASPGAFHWFAPAVMKYAQAGHSVAELSIDAHSLIALRAPRPLLVTSGVADKGDAWVDPKGMWLAVRAAGQAWAGQGKSAYTGVMPSPGEPAQLGYPLGWYQHTEGHVPWPAFEAFYTHEGQFALRDGDPATEDDLSGRDAAIDLPETDEIPYDEFVPHTPKARTALEGMDEAQTAAAIAGATVLPREDGNRVRVPAGFEVGDMAFIGDDLVLVDGTGPMYVVKGGMADTPSVMIGDIEVPPENVAALADAEPPVPAVGSPVDIPASLEEAAWQGAIWSFKYTDYTPEEYRLKPEWMRRLKCGATLIAREWALTAAHCVTDKMADHPIKVRFGTVDQARKDGEFHDVLQRVVHPGYDPKSKANDVALVRITPVTSPQIRAVRLNSDTKADLRDTTNFLRGDAQIYGFGQTKRGNISAILLTDTVSIWKRADCADAYGAYPGRINNRVICANAAGTDTCQGDSGGPLMDARSDIQVGIVSWGEGCMRRDRPGIYSSVAYYYPWIAKVVGKRALARAPRR